MTDQPTPRKRGRSRQYSDAERREHANEHARRFRETHPDYLTDYRRDNRETLNQRRRDRYAEQRREHFNALLSDLTPLRTIEARHGELQRRVEKSEVTAS